MAKLCVGVGSAGALLCFASVSTAQLLDVSGQVAVLGDTLPNDVEVQLGVDLDRDGELNSFELVEATAGTDGSYRLTYNPDLAELDPQFVAFVAELLADYQARGFDALLDDGPLPIIVRFRLEGYSTIVKRFTTMFDAPNLDVAMVPLDPIYCDESECSAAGGAVKISGFPEGTGIARAFAKAHDPELESGLFPGAFADDNDNLLISAGFTEIDLRDAAGNQVSVMPSPVSVRFEANRNSWASLRDLAPDSGVIEVPMYSFDEVSGEWVTEADGELQEADGATIDESEFESIQSGTRVDPVFVAFETTHFSTFNCDAPIRERSCVKGRITSGGQPIAGVKVSVEGVSYRGGAGEMITGPDGTFAADLMKSELADEDVDGNNVTGETFQAQVVAQQAQALYKGLAFDTPSRSNSVGSWEASCTPSECECEDLGDIETEFEPQRACEVTVTTVFSGKHKSGSGGPLAAGDALEQASLSATLSSTSLAPNPELCGEVPCGLVLTNDEGVASTTIPVIGDAPRISILASRGFSEDGVLHWYSGTTTVEGCARGETSVEVELEVDHSEHEDTEGPITTGPADSGSDSSVTSTNSVSTTGIPLPTLEPPEPEPEEQEAKSCDCRLTPGQPHSGNWLWAILVGGLGGIGWWRRRASASDPARTHHHL